jgi:hypothetical protein
MIERIVANVVVTEATPGYEDGELDKDMVLLISVLVDCVFDFLPRFDFFSVVLSASFVFCQFFDNPACDHSRNYGVAQCHKYPLKLAKALGDNDTTSKISCIA